MDGRAEETDALIAAARAAGGDEDAMRREHALPFAQVAAAQYARLHGYLKAKGRQPWEPPAGPQLINYGFEHNIYVLPSAESRVLKHTINGKFGLLPDCSATAPNLLTYREATPMEYLQRLALQNLFFGDDITLEGLGERQMTIATSQRFLLAELPQNETEPWIPHPNQSEIHEFMSQHGFAPTGGHSWLHTVHDVMAADAFPDNFIKTRDGITPIDLVMRHLTGGFAREMRRTCHHHPST